MKIRTLTKREIDEEPYRVWNAFVDLLALEHYLDLTPEQRPAHLVFWYEQEVQNGGHLQYFENRGYEHAPAAVTALGLLGAGCEQGVLREATELWGRRDRPLSQTVEQFCATALEGEFNRFDDRFAACSPSLTERLEVYLAERRSLFVTIA